MRELQNEKYAEVLINLYRTLFALIAVLHSWTTQKFHLCLIRQYHNVIHEPLSCAIVIIFASTLYICKFYSNHGPAEWKHVVNWVFLPRRFITHCQNIFVNCLEWPKVARKRRYWNAFFTMRGKFAVVLCIINIMHWVTLLNFCRIVQIFLIGWIECGSFLILVKKF
jgi:hypothetical protein